jgi:hypothetical protein
MPTDQQQRLAADLVDHGQGQQHRADRDRAGDDVALERDFLGHAGQTPQGLAIVEDDVDADELLEGGQDQTGPDDRAEAELASDVPEAGAMAFGEAGADLGDLAVGGLGAEQLGKDGAGRIVPALHDQITRALRDQEQGQQEDRSRRGLGQIHPAPRGRARDLAQAAAGVLGQEIVDQEGSGQAADDHHLLHRAHPAADLGRGDFGDIERRQDAGRADGHAAREPRGDEDGVHVGPALDQGADEEQQG